MNRKNTILIAILINAGLLSILFIAALTTQEEISTPNTNLVEQQLTLPKFDDVPLAAEPLLPLKEEPQIIEVPEQEPIVHKLPAIVEESKPEKRPSNTIAKIEPIAKPERATKQITVKKGDNLEKLARANGTSVDEIIKLNRLPSSFLKIGQVLKIPAKRTLAKAKPNSVKNGPEYYTIKVGENPWAIANKHKMKVDELLRLNGLNEEKARKLRPGDRLRIR